MDPSIHGVLIALIILITIFAMADNIHKPTQFDQRPTTAAYVGHRTN